MTARFRGLSIGPFLLAALAPACSGDDAGSDDDSTEAMEATAPASTWTSLGGVDSNFRNADETTLTLDNAGTLVEGWTFQTRGQPNGTPAVVGEHVYATATGGVYCIDRESGDLVWERDLGTTSSPTYADGVLYLHAGDTQVIALDAESGDDIWSVRSSDQPTAGITSSPVVAGDTVLVGLSSGEEGYIRSGSTFRGGVAAFDIADGAERWTYYTADPPHNGSAVWSTVSVDLEARVVYGTTGNNYTGEPGPHSDSIFAISLDDGAPLWVTQVTEDDVFTIMNLTLPDSGPDYDFGTNPILFEGEVDGEARRLVGAGQKSGIFWALDRDSGEVVWEHKVSFGATAGGIINNGAFDGERIVVAGFPGLSDAPGSEPDNGDSQSTSRIVALAVDGTQVWEKQLPAQVWGPITTTGAVTFVPVFLEMHVLEAATGKTIAVFPTDGTIATGAAIADGYAYFGSGVNYSFGDAVVNDMLHQIRLP